MIIEYVENGQVMYYDPATHQFTSKLTSIASIAALRIDGVLPENHAKKYLFDIISGLRYLHLHKVVHRDIKPENILITKDDHCKISFFATRRLLNRRLLILEWRTSSKRSTTRMRLLVSVPAFAHV